MKSIEQGLEDWQVEEIDYDDMHQIYGIQAADHLMGWYAVSNTHGIIAYFGTESDALRFRLNEINRELNG